MAEEQQERARQQQAEARAAAQEPAKAGGPLRLRLRRILRRAGEAERRGRQNGGKAEGIERHGAQAAAQQKHIGQLGRQAEADGPGAAGDAEIQAHALPLRRHTEGIDERRDGLRHAAGHCIERSRQGQALCRREKGRAAKQHQPAIQIHLFR